MKDFIKIVEDSQEELFESIKDFVAIKSVAGEAEGDMPFGSGVQKALEFALNKGEADGFQVKNVDNYGGHIDFPGETDDIVAVVGHVDIVPEGDLANWKSDPYKVEIRDGNMYGRGVLDDKGPLLIGYYAMKALHDAGFKPNKTIRVILGCDEETDWKGMEYYMAREKAPVAGFSPDADFPVIHAEKGLIQYQLKKAIKNNVSGQVHLVSMTGGTVPNAVPDNAVAVVKCSNPDEIIALLKNHKCPEKAQILTDVSGDVLTITAKGISAHGAHPDLGVNAISVLCQGLALVDFDCAEVNEAIKFYNEKIGFNFHGENAGCALSDQPSGKLSYNAGIVEIDEKEIIFTIDSRFPVTYKVDDVYVGIEAFAKENGYSINKLDYLPPLYKALDDPLIVTLMETYKKYTGDTESKPLVIGGATYAKAVPNTVAFGPVMPGQEDLCHQPNEFMKVSDIMTACKIFAEVLYNLAK